MSSDFIQAADKIEPLMLSYGHSTPATMAGRSFCMVYALVGIPLGLVMFQSIGERLNTFVGWSLKFVKRCLKAKNPEVTQTNLVMVVSVLSTILMTSMAAVFAEYERWEYFDALYYCFITLTTIGFGDLVALQKESALQSKPEYVALSLIFILFGLSVVSSAVNLLVLKFLTLNTEDERRDEQLRYTANLNSIQLEGDVITSYGAQMKDCDSLSGGPNRKTPAGRGDGERGYADQPQPQPQPPTTNERLVASDSVCARLHDNFEQRQHKSSNNNKTSLSCSHKLQRHHRHPYSTSDLAEQAGQSELSIGGSPCEEFECSDPGVEFDDDDDMNNRDDVCESAADRTNLSDDELSYPASLPSSSRHSHSRPHNRLNITHCPLDTSMHLHCHSHPHDHKHQHEHRHQHQHHGQHQHQHLQQQQQQPYQRHWHSHCGDRGHYNATRPTRQTQSEHSELRRHIHPSQHDQHELAQAIGQQSPHSSQTYASYKLSQLPSEMKQTHEQRCRSRHSHSHSSHHSHSKACPVREARVSQAQIYYNTNTTTNNNNDDNDDDDDENQAETSDELFKI